MSKGKCIKVRSKKYKPKHSHLGQTSSAQRHGCTGADKRLLANTLAICKGISQLSRLYVFSFSWMIYGKKKKKNLVHSVTRNSKSQKNLIFFFFFKYLCTCFPSFAQVELRCYSWEDHFSLWDIVFFALTEMYQINYLVD